MPRWNKTVPRGIVLNRHRIKYWLSVGAQPTRGVVRIFNMMGDDFFPAHPTAWGSASKYEKPEKRHFLETTAIRHDPHTMELKHDQELKYRQMLQEQINIVERNRRVQSEAIANLGVGKY